MSVEHEFPPETLKKLSNISLDISSQLLTYTGLSSMFVSLIIS